MVGISRRNLIGVKKELNVVGRTSCIVVVSKGG